MLHALRPSRSLPDRAAADLRSAIHSGGIVNEGRLPSEAQLVEQLGISRATLRQAISILEQEGLVQRRQGQGTFVVEPVQDLRNRLNDNFGVTDLIEASGSQPGTRDLEVAVQWADRQMVKRLALPARSRVVVARRVRLADDRLVAYTIDIIPATMLADREVDVETFRRWLEEERSVYRVVARLGLVIHYGIVTLEPVALEPKIATALELPAGTLALLMEQVDYTAEGVAVVHSSEYHHKAVETVQVYRKGPGPRL
jgi:GntR family transcriptional regulator